MRKSFSKLAVRQLSTISPRETVVRNLILMEQIRNAETIEELKALSNGPLPPLDAASIQALKQTDYLNRTFGGGNTKFVPDPTAWQNMSYLDMAAVEAKRAETWPFLVGFAVSMSLVILISKTFVNEKTIETSKYLQYMEKGRGHTQSHSNSHGHH
eukprot:CAMPEP_0202970870 /NCGR_PEP_ID=MMETSP1396-20130829/21349_1 /ASSEMBLY_ACC=CAM_ASM_000872 /TAXON_ID= /ORGANISM="Pseudokeronopsis sp., Strain Brazil" /LENGTH=155 /DNA_ID=CAMNT_0049699701 /DNA_START=31 /DNA_END=498 /DNA_ORIENTATION=+